MRRCGRDNLLHRLAIATKGIAVGGCLVLLVATSVGVASAAPAKQLHNLVACDGYSAAKESSTHVLFLTAAFDDCLGNPPSANLGVENCGSHQYEAVNTDAWLTTQPWYGGNRLADSGRTGLIGYVNNCQWFNAAWVIGWGQYGTSSLSGCGWFYDRTSNQTFDDVCAWTGQ